MTPTYRDRLRLEGLALAATGAAGSAALLATTDQARRAPANTAIQLAVLVAGLAWLGPRSARKAIGQADRVRFGRVGTGEPTPLWHVPVPVVAGAIFVGPVAKPLNQRLGLPARVARDAGWDAALRVTAGSVLVGLYQAFVLERLVGRAERRRLRTYYRMPGSTLGTGTRLGWTRTSLGRAARG